jgi:hypothetical protein
LTTNGSILFDPPANWVPCKVLNQAYNFGGNGRYYYVRHRVTATGTAPAFGLVTSHDYTGAANTYNGTIPAFDYQADLDGDGYLNDAEYAARRAGFDARFAYQGRLHFIGYNSWRFPARVSDPDTADWLRQLAVALGSRPDFNGIFMDNCLGNVSVTSGTIEPIANYAAEYGALLRSIWNALPPHPTMGQRWVLMNTAGSSQAAFETMVRYVPAFWQEFTLRVAYQWPSGWGLNWSQFEAVWNSMAAAQALTSPPPLGMWDTYADNTLAGESDPRYQYGTLCAYHMGSTADTFLNYWGGEQPNLEWKYKWCEAADHDIGSPSGTYSVWATGADPDNASLTYKVFKRQFANAVVLFKPISTNGLSNGLINGLPWNTATSHSLANLVPGKTSYRKVNPDGTLGATITSISLANSEGAILIPQ